MALAGVAALHYVWRVRHAGRAWWQELKMVMRPAQLHQLRVEQVNLRRQLEQMRADYHSHVAVIDPAPIGSSQPGVHGG